MIGLAKAMTVAMVLAGDMGVGANVSVSVDVDVRSSLRSKGSQRNGSVWVYRPAVSSSSLSAMTKSAEPSVETKPLIVSRDKLIGATMSA